MFIGLIGTRYSGKSTVCEYLKTRGFTVLRLREISNQDEDTSTAASGSVGDTNLNVPENATSSKNAGNQQQQRASAVAGPSQPISIPNAARPSSSSDPVSDLQGQTPLNDSDSYEWGSRTPESHVHRDELKEQSIMSIRRADGKSPVPSSLRFDTAGEMLDYATRNWRSDFVTEDLQTREQLDPFLKRPFFLLVEVDAPLMLRFERSRGTNLQQMIEEHDQLMYGCGPGSKTLRALRSSVNLSVVNAFPTTQALYSHLDSLNLTNPDRLRPQWDTYFMTLASLASQRSNCMKRRVGAILVRYNRILATGYNGTPRGLTNCNEGGCPRCNGKAKSGEALDECLCLHAEENALLEAGRERVGDGAVLYCNTCPCLRCSVKIVQTGVKEVVYNLAYSMDSAAADVFIGAGVILRQHTPPQ